jgi:hypothetical protein
VACNIFTSLEAGNLYDAMHASPGRPERIRASERIHFMSDIAQGLAWHMLPAAPSRRILEPRFVNTHFEPSLIELHDILSGPSKGRYSDPRIYPLTDCKSTLGCRV